MSLDLTTEDFDGRTPLQQTEDKESNEQLIGAWMLYLHFYQEAYRCLTPREKRALYLVEVDGAPYKEAAAELGVRVENLKMRIFRARRKIFTIMKRKFSAGEGAYDREKLGQQLDSRADAGRATAADCRMNAPAPAVEKSARTSGRFTTLRPAKQKVVKDMEGGS